MVLLEEFVSRLGELCDGVEVVVSSNLCPSAVPLPLSLRSPRVMFPSLVIYGSVLSDRLRVETQPADTSQLDFHGLGFWVRPS